MRQLIITVTILIAFTFSPKDCYPINPINKSEDKMPSNLSEWELYFADRVLQIEDVEGIYTSKFYDIKYYNNQLKFRNLISEYSQSYRRFVIAKNRRNEYVRYVVSSTESIGVDTLYRVGNTNKFHFKSLSLGEVWFWIFGADGSVKYADSEILCSWSLKYESILDEYKLLNNKSSRGSRLSNDILAIMARNTRRIVEQQMLKIYPTYEMYEKQSSIIKRSGTGFAISSNGCIVTNYHLVENSNNISVKGINKDFSTSYNAEAILSDKNNDLVVIKINDNKFSSLGQIPYTLSDKLVNVGESIFVLGYPLRATMGDEIKLTNGIVSSRTGFQGDVTLYQISAAVQPGNSGGPLFDSNGNIIGIVSSKHAETESVSYAIKSSYLINLISLMENLSNTPVTNNLKGKTLPEQVEIVKDYVYIIDVE